MRLAWHTPLPPMPSGIADYSFELLPLVAEAGEVEAFCPRSSRFRRPGAPPGVPVLDPKAFADRAARYDAVFFHLGNNPQHEFVYRAALEHPGVVVFHDFVMHHLIAHLYVEDGRDDRTYRELMREDYGEPGARLADLRWRGVATEFEKFVFPLNGHVARLARAIVVHSQDSADRMRAIAPDVPIHVIPHHAGAQPPEVAGISRADARRRLGLPRDAFLVGQFGFITRPKQPAAVIGGFARLAAHRPDAILLLVGADRTGGGLDRLIRRHRLEGRVRRRGFVHLREFYLHLKAVDAVVNLRYPSAGESSGTFARALAEGRATIVNDVGSFAEIPADVSLKVEVDGDQADEVGRHLIHLAEDSEGRAAMEERTRRYAATMLDPGRCRDLYLQVARSAAA